MERLKRRLRHSDWRFASAVIILALVTSLVMLFYRP
jgi:hypothetical protein